jgi:hypothetical protein
LFEAWGVLPHGILPTHSLVIVYCHILPSTQTHTRTRAPTPNAHSLFVFWLRAFSATCHPRRNAIMLTHVSSK